MDYASLFSISLGVNVFFVLLGLGILARLFLQRKQMMEILKANRSETKHLLSQYKSALQEKFKSIPIENSDELIDSFIEKEESCIDKLNELYVLGSIATARLIPSLVHQLSETQIQGLMAILQSAQQVSKENGAPVKAEEQEDSTSTTQETETSKPKWSGIELSEDSE